jgi:hypothetical protein
MSTQKVLFTRDFRSAATGDKHFLAGTVGEFEDAAVAAIIAEGAGKPALPGAKVNGPDPLADMSGGQIQALLDRQARDNARNAQARRWGLPS